MNATVGIVYYESNNLKDRLNPLLQRISKDRKIKYVSLGVSLNQKHWDFSKQQPKPSCPNREYIEKLVLAKKGQYQDKIIELTAFHKDYTPQSLVENIDYGFGFIRGKFLSPIQS